MKEQFQFLLDNYLVDKSKVVDSSTKIYKTLCRELPKIITDFLNRDDLIVKGSMGQGNKTDYPWISILNRNITQTTQRGLYVVYLFKKDMSGFYLTLNQGITHFDKLYRSKKYENAVKVANYFKSQIDNSSFSTNEISLGSHRGDLGYGYEKTTVFSKYYPSGQLSTASLRADLEEIIIIYDFIIKHMETMSYDKVIIDVLAEETSSLIKAADAVDRIKDVVDPEDDLPFGFVRRLQEVEPKVDRSNKLTALTKPKTGKIDYVKKALKDAKSGLLGEELVIQYEVEKLNSIGREDLADKIMWVSKESDSYGYDIESYDVDKKGNVKKIKIEVKTTSSKVDTEFFVSKNELEVSRNNKDLYYVYRVYDVNAESPKMYRAFGAIDENFILDPVTYMARLNDKWKS